jgi:hypothetical protein
MEEWGKGRLGWFVRINVFFQSYIFGAGYMRAGLKVSIGSLRANVVESHSCITARGPDWQTTQSMLVVVPAKRGLTVYISPKVTHRPSSLTQSALGGASIPLSRSSSSFSPGLSSARGEVG